jgi:hypothetical protein
MHRFACLESLFHADAESDILKDVSRFVADSVSLRRRLRLYKPMETSCSDDGQAQSLSPNFE